MLASPLPHSKTCDTFWASDASAFGAGLGREAFVGDFERGSVPQGLVAEHISEHRPAGIKRGLCHPRLGQTGRAHITDDDASVLAHDPRGLLMQEMPPAISHLGMDGRCTAFLAAPFRQRQVLFVSPIEGGRLDLPAIAECGEVVKSKIDPDGRAKLGNCLGDLDLDIEIPASARILGEARSFDLGVIRKAPRIPNPILATEQDDQAAIFVDPKGACGIEGYPAKISFLARSPCRTAPLRVSHADKLPRYRSERVAMQAEFRAGASHQLDKIEARRPSCECAGMPPALRVSLSSHAEIPSKIHRSSHAPQMLGAGPVFDTVAVGENHATDGNLPESVTQR